MVFISFYTFYWARHVPASCGEKMLLAQVAPVARVQSLARELPHATGVEKKKKNTAWSVLCFVFKL